MRRQKHKRIDLNNTTRQNEYKAVPEISEFANFLTDWNLPLLVLVDMRTKLLLETVTDTILINFSFVPVTVNYHWQEMVPAC